MSMREHEMGGIFYLRGNERSGRMEPALALGLTWGGLL